MSAVRGGEAFDSAPQAYRYEPAPESEARRICWPDLVAPGLDARLTGPQQKGL